METVGFEPTTSGPSSGNLKVQRSPGLSYVPKIKLDLNCKQKTL